jgi:uncharacterized protein
MTNLLKNAARLSPFCAATLCALVFTPLPVLSQSTPTKPNTVKTEIGKSDPVKTGSIKEAPVVAAGGSSNLQQGLKALDERKFEVAIKAFNDAYAGGDAEGAFYLGRMVELGVGVQPDFEKARVLYLASADKGSAKALNRLGLMHYRGEKVLQDFTAAFELICKAADKNDSDAAFNCGGLYAEGRGTTKDLPKAVAYFQKAANAGHIGALNSLGFAFRDGLGVAVDLTQSQSFFERASAKGNPVALFELATMYEIGKPVSRDLVKAHLYYNLASARQHPNASEALVRISSVLTSEDLEKAQSSAKSWKAAN